MIRPRDKYYLTFLICLATLFLFADQNLMAPNLSAIAKDLNISDSQKDEKLGGDIALGFFVLGAPAALLIGYLADSMNRCILLGVVIIFGESACLGTYWVTSYSQLFFCRVMTGISVGGATPVIYSLLGDYYSEESRIYVSTWVGIAVSAGIASGQLLSGVVGSAVGWRLPFLLVAIPANILGVLIMITGVEPRRGSQERSVRIVSDILEPVANDIHTNTNFYYQQPEPFKLDKAPGSSEASDMTDSNISYDTNIRKTNRALASYDSLPIDRESLDYSEKINWRKVAVVMRTPSAVIIFLQGIPGCIPWGMIYVFLNDYFSADRGLSVTEATIALFCFGVGGLIGQLLGGASGQWLYLRDKRYQCVLMGSSTIIGIFPMIYLLNADINAIGLFYFMAILGGASASVTAPNVRAVLQNVCAPEVRGTAFAIASLTDDLGKGVGPAILVILLRACNGDRRITYNIATTFWLASGLLFLSMVFTIYQDENSVQETILDAIQSRRYHENQCDQTTPTSEVTAPWILVPSKSPNTSCASLASIP